jgi:hypothetical protein
MTSQEAEALLAPYEASGDYELELQRDGLYWWYYYEPGAAEPHEGYCSLRLAVANIIRCYQTDPGSAFY